MAELGLAIAIELARLASHRASRLELYSVLAGKFCTLEMHY